MTMSETPNEPGSTRSSPEAARPAAAAATATPSYDLVVIAASAGGIQALKTVLSSLPAGFPVPIAVVQHRSPVIRSFLPEILTRHTPLRVTLAQEAEVMMPGTVYLAPADLHMEVRPGRTVHLFDGTRIRHVRSSANPLFASAAEVLRGRVVAVVLTGGDADATDGVQSVRNSGGIVLVQDQASSENFAMPHSAIQTGCVARVLPLEDIAPAVIELVMGNRDGSKANRPSSPGDAEPQH